MAMTKAVEWGDRNNISEGKFVSKDPEGLYLVYAQYTLESNPKYLDQSVFKGQCIPLIAPKMIFNT